jgi:two-component system chemotaxis response regulator CheB
MIANDSTVIRRLVTEALFDSGGFEVYPAVNGADVVNQLAVASPDVLVLDTDMPVMNGVQTVRVIRQEDEFLPIIMLCLSTESCLTAMTEAIPAGANDCARFTLRMGHAAAAKDHVREELIPKIRFWAEHRVRRLLETAGAGSAESP